MPPQKYTQSIRNKLIVTSVLIVLAVVVSGIIATVGLNNLLDISTSVVEAGQSLGVSDTLVESVQLLKIFTLLAVTAVLILVLVGVLLVYYLVIKPLSKLSIEVERISENSANNKITIDSNNEIGLLAHTINDIMEKLIEARRIPENILRSMQDSLFVLDIDGKITEVNDAALSVLGYKKEELLGRSIDLVLKKSVVEETESTNSKEPS